MGVNYGTYGTYVKTDNTGRNEYRYYYNAGGAVISANQSVVLAPSANYTTRTLVDGTVEYLWSQDHIYLTTARNSQEALGIAVQLIGVGESGWVQTKGFYPTANMCCDVVSSFAHGQTIGTSEKAGHATFGVGLGRLVEAWNMTAAGICANDIAAGNPNMSGLGVVIGCENHSHGELSAGYAGADHRIEGSLVFQGAILVDDLSATKIVATEVISAFDVANLSVDGAARITGDLTADSISATSNLTAAIISASGNLTADTISANLGLDTGGYVRADTMSGVTSMRTASLTAGAVSVSQNVTADSISATSNLTAAIISASGNLTADTMSANLGLQTGGYVRADTLSGVTSMRTASLTAGTISVASNITADNISATSNLTAAAISTLSLTADAIVVDTLTAASISVTGNLTADMISANLGFATSGNVSAVGDLTVDNISATSNLTADVISANLGLVTDGYVRGATMSGVTSMRTASLTAGAVSVSQNVTADSISATSNLTAAIISATGNLTANQISAYGAVTGHTTGAFVGDLTAGNISATGNLTANIISANLGFATSGDISATSNLTADSISATSNLTADVISTTGNLTADVISANLGLQTAGYVRADNVSATGNLTAAIISASGNLTADAISGAGDITGGASGAFVEGVRVGYLSSLGDIVTPLDVQAGTGLRVGGDEGTGVAAHLQFTNVSAATAAGSCFYIASSDKFQSDTNTAWLKMYMGTTIVMVPAWSCSA